MSPLHDVNKTSDNISLQLKKKKSGWRNEKKKDNINEKQDHLNIVHMRLTKIKLDEYEMRW